MDLWARLALLHQCCDLLMNSAVGADGQRVWRIVLRPRAKSEEAIEVTSDSFLDALRRSVDEAQSRGLVPFSLHREAPRDQ